MRDYLKCKFNPDANPDAIIEQGTVRFTVLTSRLIRMEYNPTRNFEDRPTQIVWLRSFPKSNFKTRLDEETIRIETDDLVLIYKNTGFGFHPDFLQITLKENQITWHYGQENHTNLKGTVRTLDRIDGAISLGPGLLSKSGWSIVDDSASLVFNDEGWLTTRSAHPEAKDLYFFGYGNDFTQCIVDFQKLSGKPPIPPRFALGNWWSRYWAYHQDDLLTLMSDFQSHGAPLSVCIVDMDWHIVETGNESSGWTGYSWNPELFPDPQGFLDDLHQMDLKTALNLHPASGVYPHETQYAKMAQRLGIDPNSRQPIPFNIADPKFTAAYFEHLHHPLEDMGVDFWWVDWQQGTKSTIEGLDPLFCLNHLHFYNLARDGKKRPFIFSRWAGLGSQRYPIGFSGDTIVTWESLQFQPYFTATAANVGYGWWSHDIGGHMGGMEEPELYLRWVQYGVFSPILRLHSTNNPYHERRPWGYDAETEKLAIKALRLRHTLIPYLYTAAWRNWQEGILPIRPMYHLYPDEANAYQCPNQYTFGSELIAAPFTIPRDEDTRMSRQVIWLPEGEWFDFFTGENYTGGGWISFYGRLETIPVFAKAGAIIPLSPEVDWGGVTPPEALTINIFPGASNHYTLYEDDGETQAYLDGAYALTKFNLNWEEHQCTLIINPVEGDKSLIPDQRTLKFIFNAVNEPENITLKLNNRQVLWNGGHDKVGKRLILSDIVISAEDQLELTLKTSQSLQNREANTEKSILNMLKTFKMNSYIKQALRDQIEPFMQDSRMLLNFADRMADTQLLALAEIWMGKQGEKILTDPKDAFQMMINQLYHG